MNPLLVVAAALAVGVSVAHSYLGERYLLIRLFAGSTLPRIGKSDQFTRRTLRFAWHLTSVAWVGLGGVLWFVETPPGSSSARAVGAVIAATFLVSAVVTATISRGRHLAWPVFAAIAVLAWLGTR